MIKKITLILCGLLISSMVFAQESAASEDQESEKKESPVSFATNTDFAYYLGSDYRVNGSGMAPLTSAYNGVELRVTGYLDYKIPVPLGTNPLTKGNNINLQASLELTPVTFLFGGEITYTPIAFLKFSAGAKLGSGWDFLGFQGLGRFEIDYHEDPAQFYDSLPALSQMYQYYYLQGLFQFDLAAVMPGLWNHVVMVASARYYWHGLTNSGKGDVWNFKTVTENANGFKYDNIITIGYQMPMVLQTVALVADFEGYLNGEDAFGPDYKNWDPDFMTVELCPTFVFQFSKNDSVTAQLSFKTRRSFDMYTDNNDGRICLNKTDYEWYFRRVALRYTHYF